MQLDSFSSDHRKKGAFSPPLSLQKKEGTSSEIEMESPENTSRAYQPFLQTDQVHPLSSVADINELATEFRTIISRSFEQNEISSFEYTAYLHEGLEDIVLHIQDSEKAMKAIQELMDALENNIAINKRKKILEQSISTLQTNANLSPEEIEFWSRKTNEINDNYNNRTIFLQESLRQLEAVVTSLSSLQKKPVTPSYLSFARLYHSASTKDFEHLTTNVVMREGDFRHLSATEKNSYLQQVAVLLEQEAVSFMQRYPIYASSSHFNVKWEKSSTITDKMKVLLRAQKNMAEGTSKREKELQGVQLLISLHQFSKAEEMLSRLKSILHPETFRFFGFNKEEEKITNMRSCKDSFLTAAVQYETREDYLKAIDSLDRASQLCDISELPALRQKMERLQHLNQARILFHEAGKFAKEGNRSVAEDYIRQATLLDPLVSSRTYYTKDGTSAMQQPLQRAHEEIQSLFRQDSKMRTLVMENELIKTVKRKAEEQKHSTTVKESGSYVDRVRRTASSEEEKDRLSRAVEQQTSSLHEQQSLRSDAAIEMILDQDNTEERVQSVLQDYKEGKRDALKITFRTTKDSHTPRSLSDIVTIEEVKILDYIAQRTREIERKHGVTLPFDREEWYARLAA